MKENITRPGGVYGICNTDEAFLDHDAIYTKGVCITFT